ncbi:MAG: type II secretion system F family protein [Rhodobacteraceae bacterium]|nr:type II secretion system F family protein [Paracoccaceae bacterium]
MGAEPIIYAVTFIAVLLLVEGLYLVAFGKSISMNSRVNRRIDLLEKGNAREEVLEKLRKERDQHREGPMIPIYSMITDRAAKANIAFTPGQLFGIMVLVAVLAFVALTLGTEAELHIRLGVSVVIGGGAVFTWVNSKANKRMKLIEEQLPDAVELMVRSLRVGHPFINAVNIVAQEVPDPLGTEFGMIADEAAYGMSVSESLKAMAERIGIQDLRFLAVAVTIQQQSGGNLAEILEGLAKVIRARFKLFRRVKAITAEAKWSGLFLSGFPLAAIVFINLIDPNYYDDVKETAYFIPGMIAVGVFLVVNVLYMRMMVNIKV